MRALRQGSNLLPGFRRDPLARRQFAPGFVATFRLAALVAGRSIPDLTASKAVKRIPERKTGRVDCGYRFCTKELAASLLRKGCGRRKGTRKGVPEKTGGSNSALPLSYRGRNETAKKGAPGGIRTHDLSITSRSISMPRCRNIFWKRGKTGKVTRRKSGRVANFSEGEARCRI